MSSRAKNRIATFLVCTVLILNGLYPLQGAAHTLLHLQHEPLSESSQGCTWACSAGEIIESPVEQFNHHVPLTRLAEHLHPSLPIIVLSSLPVSRAPPSTVR